MARRVPNSLCWRLICRRLPLAIIWLAHIARAFGAQNDRQF
jgi:hypothetical protein